MQAVTNYIVKDVIPVYTVDREEFRDMVRALNPGTNLYTKSILVELLFLPCARKPGNSWLSE